MTTKINPKAAAYIASARKRDEAAARKRAERERKRAAGLTELTLWIPPEFHDVFRDLADELQKADNDAPPVDVLGVLGKLVVYTRNRYGAVERDKNALVEALTPSDATKAAFMGEFGDTDWTTTKDIMKAILARAMATRGGMIG